MLEHQMTTDPHWIDKQVLAEGFKPQETTSAKRCVIREIDLNLLDKAEVAQLNDLIDAFCAQEEYFLRLLESKKFRRYGGFENGFRDLRNAIVRGQIPIEMRHGLQARHWKLALDCACQTTRSHWALALQRTEKKLNRYQKGKKHVNFFTALSQTEEQYVKSMIEFVNDRFFDMLDGKTPLPADPTKVPNPKALCAKVRSVVRAVKGNFPHLKRRRVCWFDVSCYSVRKLFNGDQIVSLMSLTPRKKIQVTVHGAGKIAQTIRLVRSEKGMALHVAQAVKTKALRGIPKPAHGKQLRCVGADMGFSEVFTDDAGNQFGCELGEVIRKQAEWLSQKLAQRNKLQELYKKTKSPHKRANILRFNLGEKRFEETMKRFRARLANIVNRALNEMLRKNPADVYLVEKLCARFRFRRHTSKKAKNKLSMWIRGIIHDRLEFKAFVNEVKLFYVPAAYTSQRCPVCGLVNRDNRKGDNFRCLKCGHVDQADRNGARNILMAPHHGFFNRNIGKYKIKNNYDEEHQRYLKELQKNRSLNSEAQI